MTSANRMRADCREGTNRAWTRMPLRRTVHVPERGCLMLQEEEKEEKEEEQKGEGEDDREGGGGAGPGGNSTVI